MENQTEVVITTSKYLQNLSNKVDSVSKNVEDLKKNFKPKEPEEYLTRHEVAQMFKIDISSVHNWTKKGKLKSYGVPGSGRVYYLRSHIEKVLVEINHI